MSNYNFTNEYTPIIVNQNDVRFGTFAPSHIYHDMYENETYRHPLLDGAQINWKGLTLFGVNFSDSGYRDNGYEAWVEVFNRLQDTINELETRLSALENAELTSITLSTNPSTYTNLDNGSMVTLTANGLPSGRTVTWSTTPSNSNYWDFQTDGNSATATLNHSEQPNKGTLSINATGGGSGYVTLKATFTAGSSISIEPLTVNASYNGINVSKKLTAKSISPLSKSNFTWAHVTPANLPNISLEVNQNDDSICTVRNSSTTGSASIIIRVSNNNANPSSVEWTGSVPTAVATTYTISYNANGGNSTPSSQTGTTITLAAAITRNEDSNYTYTFKNWNTASNGTGTSYSAGQTITLSSNLTLYAQWTATPKSQPTGQYKYYYGSDEDVNLSKLNSVGIAINSPLTTLTQTVAPDPSKYIYFIYPKSWGAATILDSDGDGVGLYDYTEFYQYDDIKANYYVYTASANKSLGAVFSITYESQPIIQYTVTYNKNGGNTTPSSQTGTTITLAAAITRNDDANYTYSFKNWNTSSNGTGTSYLAGSSITLSSNLTLYANWTKTAKQSTNQYKYYYGSDEDVNLSKLNSVGIAINSPLTTLTQTVAPDPSKYIYFIYPKSWGTATILDNEGDGVGLYDFTEFYQYDDVKTNYYVYTANADKSLGAVFNITYQN
jgi:hypothetical protein